MKGDRVEVVIDAGDRVREFEVTARRAGRRIDIRSGRGVTEVTEVTRTGQPVRTARFMSSRVIAIVEHPVADSDGPAIRPAPDEGGRRATHKAPARLEQAS